MDTRLKGTIGELNITNDLLLKDFIVYKPTVENQRFDLLVEYNKMFYKIQVKYRTSSNGKIFIQNSSVGNAKGKNPVRNHYTENDYDVLAVYCPCTDSCYYLTPEFLQKSKNLRINPPKNNQKINVYMANDYTSFPLCA